MNAQVALLAGVSGHADQSGLLNWVRSMQEKPQLVFINHSEYDACVLFAEKLTQIGLNAQAPYSGSVYNLAEDKWEVIAKPKVYESEKKKRENAAKDRAFNRLVANAKRLLKAAENSRSRSSRDIAKFADAIETLVDRWTR